MRRSAPLLLVLALAPLAPASTVLRMGPDELTDRAQVIIHATCIQKQPRLRADGAVVTDYRFTVHAFLKGGTARSFAYTAYGGILGDRGTAVAGSPTFEEGEEVLLFLDSENKQGCRTAIGLAQGKYSIRLVEGTKLAFRDLEGLRLLDPKSGEAKEAQPEQGVEFETLLARVKQRIETTKKQG